MAQELAKKTIFAHGTVGLPLPDVSLRVAILLASTSGWLKALIPRMAPATAVAKLRILDGRVQRA